MTKVLLVGPGGWGRYFVKILLENTDPEIKFEGIVARTSCYMREEVEAAGVPIYHSVEEFYAEHSADFAIVCTPSFLHCEQSIYCLEHGSNVLCEKPAAPTVAECEKMLAAEKATGRFIGIGFNRAYAPATLELKQDILNGMLGKPVSMKAVVSTERKHVYYGRGSGYAGCISKNGHMVLDSVASNACAHQIFNMLFLLGDKMDTAAFAELAQCECYRANDIENFDTCTMKLTAAGIPVYYGASHAGPGTIPYTFALKYEKGTVTEGAAGYTVTFNDGTVKEYVNPPKLGERKKLMDCIDAARKGERPVCTVATTLPHVKLIEDIYHSIPIQNFPEEEKTYQEDWTFVPTLNDRMIKAYEKECMLSEV